MANIIKCENAKIIFRNFAGKPTKFNSRGGVRDFAVILNPEDAEMLANDGWNIKYLKSRDEQEDPTPYLKVKVSFEGAFPPSIYMITGRKKTPMTEDTIASLDYAEIENVDLTIRPYTYDVNGKQGIAAYLKNMYVTVVLDDFASKYDFEDDDEEYTMPFN